MRNKVIIVTGMIFISIAILGLNLILQKDVKSIIYQNKIINKEFNSNGNKIAKVQTANYLGYIKIEKLKLKRLIKEGTTDDVLDQLIVGHVENSSNLDSPLGNSILAGHNTYIVFSRLRYLDINDEIEIVTNKTDYIYKIIVKKEIDINDKTYFMTNSINKVLTLITCTNDKNKRLIIVAKKT